MSIRQNYVCIRSSASRLPDPSVPALLVILVNFNGFGSILKNLLDPRIGPQVATWIVLAKFVNEARKPSSIIFVNSPRSLRILKYDLLQRSVSSLTETQILQQKKTHRFYEVTSIVECPHCTRKSINVIPVVSTAGAI